MTMEEMAMAEAAGEVFRTGARPEIERRPDGMKTITVHLPDEVYRQLRQAVMVRGALGPLFALPDQFLARLMELVDDGRAEHTFSIEKGEIVSRDARGTRRTRRP